MVPPNRDDPSQHQSGEDAKYQQSDNRASNSLQPQHPGAWESRSSSQYSPQQPQAAGQPGAYPQSQPLPQNLPPHPRGQPPHLTSPQHPLEGARPEMQPMHAMQYRLPEPHHPFAGPPPNPYHHPAGVQYGAPPPAPRQRTAIACRYCRRRKIRCSGFDSSEDGRCTNCIRFSQECMFMPVASQSHHQAFVPAHTVWRGNGQPPALYGAYGQPLPTPAQQQPQTPLEYYPPGSAGRQPRPRTLTPPGQDPHGRGPPGYSAGPSSVSYPVHPYGAGVGEGRNGDATSSALGAADRKPETHSHEHDGDDQSIKKRTTGERQQATLPPPLRPSWSSAKTGGSESQLPDSAQQQSGPNSASRPAHSHSAAGDTRLPDRSLTSTETAYPPPPPAPHHQQHHGGPPPSPYYAGPLPQHPQSGPPRHDSPHSAAYPYDAHRTSTSPHTAAPTTPSGPAPFGPYSSSESTQPQPATSAPSRSNLAAINPHDGPAHSPTSATSSQPGSQSGAGRASVAIRDILTNDSSGGRSAADSQMLNQLNRRPM